MALTIVEHAGLTDVGRQRTTNEDSFYEGSPLFAVADGMGGARAGEVAARLAVEVLAEMGDRDGASEARLEALVKEANRRIYELAQRDESRAGMGCTLTAAIVCDGEVTIGHVGDSRAYRLRGDELAQLTSDHSLVEELVRQGKLAPEQAEDHPQRSIITRALGPEPDVDVDAFTHAARPGDVYLLCSDGLTVMLPDARIAEILRGSPSLERAARELVDAANASGGRDNITVVLFRVAEDEAGADDEDTLSGAETGAGLTVDQVRAAAGRGRATLLLDRDTAREERERAAAAPARAGPQPARPRSARRRRAVTAVVLTLAAAVVVVGLYAGSRQLWFVGSNDQGLLTLYRGVPYELPLGIELYSEEYVSSFPVSAIESDRRRRNVLDHRLRERGEAVELIRQYERSRLGA